MRDGLYGQAVEKLIHDGDEYAVLERVEATVP